MRRAFVLLLPVFALVAIALPAAAAEAYTPTAKALYHDGPSGRYLLDGEWLFRLDPSGVGLSQGFHKQTGRTGWNPVRVPNVWNLGDDSVASMQGGVGWYRKDFELPSAKAALAWAVRFESVNYRSRVWLNGRRVGTNRGAYIPFEFRLGGLKRRGANRLVIRVDSRRRPTDFPPSGLATNNLPTGGWWNYGGLQREVYLKRLDTVDWKDVRVRPRLSCGTCAATVEMKISLRNVRPQGQRVTVTGRFGNRSLRLGSKGIARGGVSAFTKTFRVPRPRVWSPANPNLYPVRLQAKVGGRTVGSYVLNTGIRSIKVGFNGRLVLNGQYVNFRGMGLHEDSKEQGFAIDNRFRQRLVAETKALGATVMRTHYPLHPYMHELADREGLMIWSEVPVYSIKTQYLKQPLVRQLAAKELEKNILANQNHPSVMLWSIANELSARPGPVQGSYIKHAAAQAKALDPTRPVGIAVAGYPGIGCQAEYGPLDVIGVNEYFGWYPGPNGTIFDRTKLSAYLDSVRQCYPDKAVVVSEFGAEANRDGPVEEKGTWTFQQDFVNFHLGVHASKPWLSGAIYWAMNEFRVRPGWEGGNPRPQAPIHQKGLLRYGDLSRKPAWADVQRSYAATQQFVAPGAPQPPAAPAGNR
jgi:beta-glucuronidase